MIRSLMVRCRVIFFDNHHRLNRTIEVDAPSPAVAASQALKRLAGHGVPPEELADNVRVQIITSVNHVLSLKGLMSAPVQVA